MSNKLTNKWVNNDFNVTGDMVIYSLQIAAFLQPIHHYTQTHVTVMRQCCTHINIHVYLYLYYVHVDELRDVIKRLSIDYC